MILMSLRGKKVKEGSKKFFIQKLIEEKEKHVFLSVLKYLLTHWKKNYYSIS